MTKIKEVLCLNCHKAWAKLRGGSITSCGNGFTKIVEEYCCDSCKYCFRLEKREFPEEKPDPCKEKPFEMGGVAIHTMIHTHEANILELGSNYIALKERVEKLEKNRKIEAYQEAHKRISDFIVEECKRL